MASHLEGRTEIGGVWNIGLRGILRYKAEYRELHN
jgi:hypothetical protein